MSAALLTIIVEEPLLTKGGTVVVLETKLDQSTFDERYGASITRQNNTITLDATVDSVVSFVEVDAPPGFEYRFQTREGSPVAERQVSVGEGGGYIDVTTEAPVTADITFHHHIKGSEGKEANSRALDGTYFRIDPATCRVQPAVRVCSGSEKDLEEMLRAFQRSETP